MRLIFLIRKLNPITLKAISTGKNKHIFNFKVDFGSLDHILYFS